MDRCRCEDYADAVQKVKFYTVGTYRPDVIERYDRSKYTVRWIRNNISVDNLNFTIPSVRVRYPPGEEPTDPLSHDARKIEQMWCPFMKVVRKI